MKLKRFIKCLWGIETGGLELDEVFLHIGLLSAYEELKLYKGDITLCDVIGLLSAYEELKQRYYTRYTILFIRVY